MIARTSRLPLFLVAALLAVTATAGAGREACAQTLDELLAKHYQARGGLDKLKAVKSLRMTGKMSMGPGMEAPLTIEFKRPMRMRVDFTLQGMSGAQAYDGKAGWQLMPFMGNPNAEAVGAEDLKQMEEQADLEGVLVDWKAKGHLVELVGKEPVAGADAYKLKVTLKNGDTHYSFLDATSFLEVRSEGKMTRMGAEVEIESTMRDFKQVDGLTLPFVMDSGQKGSTDKQVVTIEKIEVNVPIEDARFAMPAPKPAAAPPATTTPPAETPKKDQ